MRTITVLGLSLFFVAATPFQQRQLFIPSRATELVRHFDAVKVLAFDRDAAVIELPGNEIQAWSAYVHEELGTCGGFVDASEEMTTGKSAERILREYQASLTLRPFTAPREILHNQRVAQLLGAVDVDNLKTFLTELTSFDDRAATSENGGRAAEFIANRATELGKGLSGFRVRRVATKYYPLQPSIVASLEGTNAKLPHIVIGAHMDTYPDAKPGADDDGSGSTVVMEALRAVAASQFRFERTIDFVWYAAEELGLVGSSSVVQDFRSKRIDVDGVIHFDMTAWVDPHGLYDIYLTDDFTNLGLTQTLEKIINVYLPDVTIGHARCGYSCSDHASWTRAGVPAVYPFESHHDASSGTIHTSADTIDKLSMVHCARFAKIAVAFLGQMAVVQ